MEGNAGGACWALLKLWKTEDGNISGDRTETFQTLAFIFEEQFFWKLQKVFEALIQLFQLMGTYSEEIIIIIEHFIEKLHARTFSNIGHEKKKTQ